METITSMINAVLFVSMYVDVVLIFDWIGWR